MATTTKTVKTTVKKETPVEQTASSAVVVRKYEADDTVPVRSITQGELLMPGRKSGILYRWAGAGDVEEVEYQDLYALKVRRSAYVYEPLFVIDDEELLADPKWKDVVALYQTMYDTEDISAILRLPVNQFKKVLKQVPKGLLNSIKVEVATQIENGKFDSINKIKAIDELCGTDLLCLIK